MCVRYGPGMLPEFLNLSVIFSNNVAFARLFKEEV